MWIKSEYNDLVNLNNFDVIQLQTEKRATLLKEGDLLNDAEYYNYEVYIIYALKKNNSTKLAGFYTKEKAESYLEKIENIIDAKI